MKAKALQMCALEISMLAQTAGEVSSAAHKTATSLSGQDYEWTEKFLDDLDAALKKATQQMKDLRRHIGEIGDD